MQWKVLKENNLYEVSEYGDVRKIGTTTNLKPRITEKGYHRVSLNDGDHFVHRLVANNYLSPPTAEQIAWAAKTHYKIVQVNHLKGKANNHYTALEWATNSENVKHAFDSGLVKPRLTGYDNDKARLTADDTQYIITHYKPGDRVYGATALGRKFGVTKETIIKYFKKYS